MMQQFSEVRHKFTHESRTGWTSSCGPRLAGQSTSCPYQVTLTYNGPGFARGFRPTCQNCLQRLPPKPDSLSSCGVSADRVLYPTGVRGDVLYRLENDPAPLQHTGEKRLTGMVVGHVTCQTSQHPSRKHNCSTIRRSGTSNTVPNDDTNSGSFFRTAFLTPQGADAQRGFALNYQ